MWNVYGDCENYATLKGHSGAVMELHYNTDGRYDYDCRWSKMYYGYANKEEAMWTLTAEGQSANVKRCVRLMPL